MTIPHPPTLQPMTFLCPTCSETHAAWTGNLPDGTMFQTTDPIGQAQVAYDQLFRRAYVRVKVRGN